MLIDVDDPTANFILNGCFYGLVVVTLLSVVPWSLRGGKGRWTFFLPLAALALYGYYEATMPVRYDIRLDLLLLLPMGGIVFLSWLIRLVLRRQPQNR